MEEMEREELPQEEPKQSYQPRPAWQIWAAWAGVVFMVAAFLMYCYQIATGGL